MLLMSKAHTLSEVLNKEKEIACGPLSHCMWHLRVFLYWGPMFLCLRISNRFREGEALEIILKQLVRK